MEKEGREREKEEWMKTLGGLPTFRGGDAIRAS